MNKLLLFIFMLYCCYAITSNDNYQISYEDSFKFGINKTEIDKFISYTQKKNLELHYMAVLKESKIVSEYANNYNPESFHDIASVTKIFISMLIGILEQEKFIDNINDDITKYLPEYHNLRGISVKSLLTMTSGLNGYRNEDLFKLMASSNWEGYIKSLKKIKTPGKKFSYNNINYHILSILISRTTKMKADKLLEEKIFNPLGITEYQWDKDPNGNPYGWGNLKLKAHDLLKVAILIKNKGAFKGQQLISEKWLTESMEPYIKTSSNPFFRLEYGYGWFVPKGLKEGFNLSLGRGGQTLFIFPDKDLIIMTLGNYDISSLLLKIPSLVEKIETDAPYFNFWDQLEGTWEFEDNYLGLESINFTNNNSIDIDIIGRLLSINSKISKTGDPIATNNKYNIGDVKSLYNYTEEGNLIITISEIGNINTFEVTVRKSNLFANKLKIRIKEHQLIPKEVVLECKKIH